MKPSPRPASSAEESQRALRLRDNKRRHRQNQKDYTANLEFRLRELEAKGVQATQEVQRSARKVVEENARLKALLRHLRIEEHVIESWRTGEREEVAVRSRGCERRGVEINEAQHGSMSSAPYLNTATQISTPPTEQPDPSTWKQETPQSNCNRQETSSPSLTTQLAVCKILTRLAEDPGADVTLPTATDEHSADQESGGVECSKAHKMLMQFATTEEKLDVISQALERGCVGRAGGGCKVRNEAIWKAIDDVT